MEPEVDSEAPDIEAYSTWPFQQLNAYPSKTEQIHIHDELVACRNSCSWILRYSSSTRS